MNDQQGMSERVVYRTSPKVAFAMGILAGVAVLSTIGFGVTLAALRGDDAPSKTTNSNVGTVAGVDDTDQAGTNTAAPAPVDIVITDEDHIRGAADAPITIVEYSDFECPYCSRHTPTIEQILDAYPDQVRVIFRHFPLSFHQNAQKAAEASECAAAQGKFWEMHDKLFALNDAGSLSVDSFKSAAGELGLNQTTFDTCLDTGTYAQKVQDSFDSGVAYGVEGTPATFVNGQLVSGAVPFSSFQTMIDSLL